MDPAEENRQLRSALHEAKRQLGELGAENMQLKHELARRENDARRAYDQLRRVRNSTSWKLTEPLRRVKELL